MGAIKTGLHPLDGGPDGFPHSLTEKEFRGNEKSRQERCRRGISRPISEFGLCGGGRSAAPGEIDDYPDERWREDHKRHQPQKCIHSPTTPPAAPVTIRPPRHLDGGLAGLPHPSSFVTGAGLAPWCPKASDGGEGSRAGNLAIRNTGRSVTRPSQLSSCACREPPRGSPYIRAGRAVAGKQAIGPACASSCHLRREAGWIHFQICNLTIAGSFPMSRWRRRAPRRG